LERTQWLLTTPGLLDDAPNSFPGHENAYGAALTLMLASLDKGMLWAMMPWPV
jgi:hypothetical protein